ncbi:MAG: zinc ribbon domain-containing protein [Proteobacteria bacterium]|nr:MAG: zinc ribbon domain-containing protein [Pseudomonadota bacterium]
MHCSACGSVVAEGDNFCPSCGKDLKSQSVVHVAPAKKKSNIGWKIFAGLVMLFSVGKCSSVMREVTPPSSPASVQPLVATQHWEYSSFKDEMTGKTTTTARIDSINEVEFEFPYQGAQRMTLTLRKKGSADVLLQIKKGQFVCAEYDNCYVSVRFDEGSPERFPVTEASDHSTDTRFIENSSRFIAKVKKAKLVRIEATFYQEGSRVFTFDVGGIQWK